MNILERILGILNFQTWKEASSLPGWRNQRTRMRHSRKPFSSSRPLRPTINNFVVEQFTSKESRDSRWRSLRESGKAHVTRGTNQSQEQVRLAGGRMVEGEMVWEVRYPR
jgi:hypothetical protein